ncbi:MAG TPA: glycosyltransferase [Petrotogaceae bacterium]|nr:glycosyltransferase [Petrotogaceae bacterium]
MKILLASSEMLDKDCPSNESVRIMNLEKGLRENENTVETCFYKTPEDLFSKLKSKIIKNESFEKNFLQIKNSFKKVDVQGYEVINPHDVVCAGGFSGNMILSVSGYFSREVIAQSNADKKKKLELYDAAMSVEKSAIMKSKAIIACSRKLKGYISGVFKYPEEKIYVVGNSVDSDMFSPAEKDKVNSIRDEFSFDKDKFMILIPRIKKVPDNIDKLCRIIDSQKINDAFYVFCGWEDLKSTIEEKILNKNRCYFVGESLIEQQADLYRASDFVLDTSVYSDIAEINDGQVPPAALKALSSGVVYVCLKNDTYEENFVDGQNMIMLKDFEKEVFELVYQKLTTAGNFMEDIGRNARKLVLSDEKDYSHYTNAKKYGKIFEYAITL